MAASSPTEPDPRTAADDDEDATATPAAGQGLSTAEPAEGGDDAPGEDSGSPRG
jgi:hypothetical protein